MAPQPSQPTRGYAAVARGRPAGASKVVRPRTVVPAPVVGENGNARKGPAGAANQTAGNRPTTEPVPAAVRAARGHDRPAPSDRNTGMPSQAETTSRVAQLRTMGFSEESARRALVAYAWDVNKALDSLLTSGDHIDAAAAFTSAAPTLPSKPARFASPESDMVVLAKRHDSDLATKHAKEIGDLVEKSPVTAAPQVLGTLPQALPESTVDQSVGVSVQTTGHVVCDSKGEHNTRQAELLPQMSSGIMQLKMMGFSEAAAKQALVTHAWDVNKALDGLLAQGALSSTVSDVGDALAVDSTTGPHSSDPVFSNSASVVEVTLDNDRIQQTMQEYAKEKDDLLEDSFSTVDVSSGTGTSPRSSIERQNDAKHTNEAASTMSSESSQEEEVLLGVQETTSEAARVAEFQSMQTVSATCDTIGETSDDAAHSVCNNEPSDAPGHIPRKEVFRVKLPWVHDSSSDQLGVEQGDFVLAWAETQTENGWIYAEDIGGAGRAGWVPSTVLEEPQCGRKWMCATRSWEVFDERQMGVQEGKVFSLYVDSRTELGWVYAEVADKYKLCANAENASLLDESGWVPDYCFEWPTV